MLQSACMHARQRQDARFNSACELLEEVRSFDLQTWLQGQADTGARWPSRQVSHSLTAGHGLTGVWIAHVHAGGLLVRAEQPQTVPALKKIDGVGVAHVHAGGLLVRAEQWRRAGNLDDLDLAATRVGRAGQALVRVRGPLVLRSVQTPAVLVTVRQISAPASYAAGGRLFGHALRLTAVRGRRATPGHCATCQTGRGRSL